MKAPQLLSSAINKVAILAAFLPLVLVVYPHFVAAAYAAQNSGEKALVFEVNSNQNTDNSTSLTYDQILGSDPLVTKVRQYLESKGSPLAPYADQIVQQPQWQRALAISYVESNFGIRCANNNCSGIGVRPGTKSWRTYDTKLSWFKDMSALLEKPTYKEKYTNCNSMKGVYVVPGSARWVDGCNKVSNELLALTSQAEQERVAMAHQASQQNSVQAAVAEVQFWK